MGVRPPNAEPAGNPDECPQSMDPSGLGSVSGEICESSAPDTPTAIARRYRVVRRIGIGGAAEIFEVIDQTTNESVALKRLRTAHVRNRNAVALFEREYYTLKGFEHPSIIRVFEYGFSEAPYYTMELLGGKDLRELAPLPYRLACRHLGELASCLALLHTRRLLHRDISPRNARVDDANRCKLIDFGALTPFGASRHLVGTPPCVPPEAYYRRPLDQRADLYSLGAAAYFALTRQHAYPARRFGDLEHAWSTPPICPSARVPGIPRKLDDLVLSLLSHDPAERPGSAAEVIERLEAIANIQVESDQRIAHAYLRSPRLIGRDREIDLLRVRLGGAIDGAGSSLWIEAAAGLGKTRLATELSVMARQRGAVCISADAEHQRGAFEIAEAIVWTLVDEHPDVSLDLAHASAQVLGELSLRLRRRLGVEDSAVHASAGERRAALTAALGQFICAFSEVRPICIVVDNAHYMDQASAGLLLALTENVSQTALLVACTHRTGDASSAWDVLAKVRERATVVQVVSLTPSEVEQLSESLFGSVRNIHRFADWVARRSGGNPLYCLELGQHAVDSGLARYEHGAWSLPDELPAHLTSATLEEALSQALARLTPGARTIAEVLSLHRGVLTPELCTLIGREIEGWHAHLGELLESGILISHEDTYRFRLTAVRRLLHEGITPTRRQAIHGKLARALLSLGGDNAYAEVEAAWHLLHAGDEKRGADLLAALFSRWKAGGSVEMDFSTGIPALEATVEVYRRQGRHPLEQVPLLSALVEASYFHDRRLAERYGEDALTLLLEQTGVTRAERLAPRIGRPLALAVGLATAWARFKIEARRGRHQYTFEELLNHLFTVVTYQCGIASLCLDSKGAKRCADKLEPFTVLGPKQAPSVVYEYCQCLALLAQDRLGEARRRWLRLISELSEPKRFTHLPEESRILFLGGAWYALGVLESFRDDGSVLQCCTALERLGTTLYKAVADRLRVAHHAHRGEEHLADELRTRLDIHATQTASIWQVEVWDAAASITSFYREGDALGLKRCAERLHQLAEEIPSLLVHARVADGLHAMFQGDPERFITTYRALREYRRPREHIGWAATLAQTACAHNAANQHEQARDLCRSALTLLTEEDLDFVVMTLDVQIQLWRAEAALGNAPEAAREIDRLLDAFADRGPVTLAQLHAARTEISLALDDRLAARRHADAMERAARPTQNSTLLSQWRRVAQATQSLVPVSGVQKSANKAFESFAPWRSRLDQLHLAVPQLEPPTAVEDDPAEYTATESHFE